MKKKIVLNGLGVLAIILLIIVQIGAKFAHTKYQLTYISPWIPVVINSCIILLLGLIILFNFSHTKKFRLIITGLILLCLFVFIGFTSQSKEIKENHNLYSLSPNKKNIFYLKKDGDSVTYYQTYYLIFGKMREVLPYSVKKIGKPVWVTNDVAAVTYEDTRGNLHIYLGTYGYRGDAISYNYVTSLSRGIWANTNADFTMSNILGHIEIKDKTRVKNYSSDQIVQFGTSGVVLTDKVSANYAYVIPEDAQYESDSTPNNLEDIQLLALKPNLEEMKVIKLKHIGNE